MPDNTNLSSIEEAMLVFNNVTENLLNDEEQFATFDLQYNYLPQFLTDWVICHAWFLYFTESVQSAVSMLRNVVKNIQSIISAKCYRENQ